MCRFLYTCLFAYMCIIYIYIYIYREGEYVYFGSTRSYGQSARGQYRAKVHKPESRTQGPKAQTSKHVCAANQSIKTPKILGARGPGITAAFLARRNTIYLEYAKWCVQTYMSSLWSTNVFPSHVCTRHPLYMWRDHVVAYVCLVVVYNNVWGADPWGPQIIS